MAALRAIKSRVTSVEKIKKITNALEIVALTRLRRMEQDTIAARGYFDRIREMLFDMAANINFKSHPFLERGRPVRTIGIISIFSDKGLCGDFNANIANRFSKFCSDRKDKKIKAVIIGKKGIRYLNRKRSPQILNTYSFKDTQAPEKGGLEIARPLVEAFLKEEMDEIYLLYSKFRRHLLGEAKIVRVLPFALDEAAPEKKAQYQRDYIYEPGPYGIFDSLVREYIVNQVRQGVLESRSAEEMSRMLAMKSATDNAEEMIGKLGLSYHKGRQAQITRELAEVMSAAEA